MIALRVLAGLAAGIMIIAANGCANSAPSTARGHGAILAEAKRFAKLQSGGNAETESQLANIKEEMIRSARSSPKALTQEALTPGVIDFVTAAVIEKIRPVLKAENAKMTAEIASKAADFFTYDELRQINAYSQSNAAQLVDAAIRKASKPWPVMPDGRPASYSIGIKEYEADLPPGRLNSLSAEDLRARQRFDNSPANVRLGAFLPVLGEIRGRTAEEFLKVSAPIVSRTMADAKVAFMQQAKVDR